jgi:hypothetical protein
MAVWDWLMVLLSPVFPVILSLVFLPFYFLMKGLMRARKYFSLSKRELKKKYQNFNNDPSVGSLFGMKLTQEEYSEPLISSAELW